MRRLILTLTFGAFTLAIEPVCAGEPVVAVNQTIEMTVADIETLAKTNPKRAFQLMKERSQASDPKAQDRLGGYYRKGVGTTVDLMAAKDWYEKSVAGGRNYALSSLARVELQLGNQKAAYDLLVQAIEAEMPGTKRQFGFAHLDKKFGKLSDPKIGFSILMQLLEKGDDKVAVPLLLRYNWRRQEAPAPTKVVSIVEAKGLAGDAKAAEAALLYISLFETVSNAQIKRRSDLIKTKGIRSKFKSPESIKLARDTKPRHFWLEADRILASVSVDDFAQTAFTIYKINNNAFFRIMQRKLNEKGYNSGRPDGILGRKTIHAMTQFCKDHGIWDACAHGPRKSVTIKAIAEKLRN